MNSMNVVTLPNMRVAEPQLLARSIAANLEAAIIHGELHGGMRLTEEIVCQMTGFSRSPIREALRLLESDGLVVREPRRGVRVSELTVEELDELYVCRIALESTAAALAVKHGTDAEIAAIREAHEECERRLPSPDAREHFAANVEMSNRLFAAAHNKPLTRLLGTINKQALRYRFMAYQSSLAVRQNSVQCNRELIACLARRDEEGAARMARTSSESSHQVIRECLLARHDGRGTLRGKNARLRL